MHIVCPHCHNPIELVGTLPGDQEVHSPSCGSSFCSSRYPTQPSAFL